MTKKPKKLSIIKDGHKLLISLLSDGSCSITVKSPRQGSIVFDEFGDVISSVVLPEFMIARVAKFFKEVCLDD